MRVLVCMWVGIRLTLSIFLLFLLLLLGLARGFLALLPSKLFSLQLALFLLSQFEFGFFFGVQLLLLKPLLCCCRCLGAKILYLLFFLCQFNLSFLFFNYCLHLGLLHETGFRHHRPMAHCRRKMDALSHRCVRNRREIRC